jgi:hypothetical protein
MPSQGHNHLGLVCMHTTSQNYLSTSFLSQLLSPCILSVSAHAESHVYTSERCFWACILPVSGSDIGLCSAKLAPLSLFPLQAGYCLVRFDCNVSFMAAWLFFFFFLLITLALQCCDAHLLHLQFGMHIAILAFGTAPDVAPRSCAPR